ncbi:MAG: prolipoprotein diacylglyceryl transferase [Patescibacteria group bacterium]|jgi:phosphatidylglycerol:prolipoprotein diacylglycerol transferase
MINFLHTFNPSPILFSFGPINLYWYGFFILLGTLAAITVSLYLAKLYNLKTEIIIDLAFWLIISGIIGARIYDVILEWSYFSNHLLDIFKIWQGGLAIHGGIIGGALALYFYAKKYNYNFWQLAAITVTVLPISQAIGRFGNYFNQELFGYPTSLPWGIPIDLIHRPWQYFDYSYFHPAFLYESIGNLIIFLILIFLQILIIKKQKISTLNYKLFVIGYIFLYSLLRFFLEFIRIDETPIIFGWRLPQLLSFIIILLIFSFFVCKIWQKIYPNKALEK